MRLFFLGSRLSYFVASLVVSLTCAALILFKIILRHPAKGGGTFCISCSRKGPSLRAPMDGFVRWVSGRGNLLHNLRCNTGLPLFNSTLPALWKRLAVFTIVIYLSISATAQDSLTIDY